MSSAHHGRLRSDPLPESILARRIAAYLLDVTLLFAVLAPANFLVQRAVPGQATTPPEIWHALLLGFSLPSWLYFTLSDASKAGASVGKRCLGLAVLAANGHPPRWPRAVLRTALKLLPWETVHVAAFALGDASFELRGSQSALLVTANLLALVWLAVAVRSRGMRSVHDVVTGTRVLRAR